jgi:hypothetical protein
MSAKKLAPLSGVGAVALIIASFAVAGNTPGIGDSASKIASFYNDKDSQQMIAGGLLAWAALLFLVFATTLAGTLRKAQGETGGSSALSFGGGVIFTLGLAIFGAITFTLGDGANNLDPVAMQALNALNEDLFFPVAIGGGAFLLGGGTAILKTGTLPKWLGWLAIVIGVVAITPAGFVGFMALGVWTIIASIMLAMRAETA